MAYPSTIDAPDTTMQGNTLVATDDHALAHRVVGSAVVAIENKVGLGAGSAAANQILVGSGPGTASWGTVWNNATLGTPSITGGTIGTATITGGTINNATLGTPAITGGTITSPIIQTYDGWIQSADTFVYVSSSSFKITGVDRTATYTKGTRVKFTNNSVVVYGVVISSSFSTDTTVNLAVNTDYSINNSAITSPFYSYAINPQGYPNWFNFTPGSQTWDGTPPTTATTMARFSVTGTLCTVQIRIAYTNAGTTNTQFTCTGPIAAAQGQASKFLYAFLAYMTDNGQTGAPVNYQTWGGIFTSTPTLYANKSSSISANSVAMFVQYEI